MDERNSEEAMLEHIRRLENKIVKVHEIGLEGIYHVGAANYAEREQEAIHNLNAAYYDEIYED